MIPRTANSEAIEQTLILRDLPVNSTPSPVKTPMANAMLALVQSLGLEMESFGDSNGTLSVAEPITDTD